MSTRALAAAIIATAALWGCAKLPIIIAGPPSVTATKITCDGTGPCTVRIVDPCTWCNFKVDAEEVHLMRGKNNIKLVWQLPDGYVFCTRAYSDGGVVLKGSNDRQFDGMLSTDDPNGGNPSSSDCKKHQHFRWNAVNSTPRPDYGYSYTINFYHKSGAGPYTIDPWIYND
ncbi:MAG TPA: hypothetical protein VGR42_04040 [Casimicrobiaceae bacterium]|jgi:hypothetical protein|nr:hypothetical protein [Casimicrobiaceae bacterium]